MEHVVWSTYKQPMNSLSTPYSLPIDSPLARHSRPASMLPPVLRHRLDWACCGATQIRLPPTANWVPRLGSPTGLPDWVPQLGSPTGFPNWVPKRWWPGSSAAESTGANKQASSASGNTPRTLRRSHSLPRRGSSSGRRYESACQ